MKTQYGDVRDYIERSSWRALQALKEASAYNQSVLRMTIREEREELFEDGFIGADSRLTPRGQSLGNLMRSKPDWRPASPPASRAEVAYLRHVLDTFREFVLHNVTQTKGWNGHPIWPLVAEAIGEDRFRFDKGPIWKFIQHDNQDASLFALFKPVSEPAGGGVDAALAVIRKMIPPAMFIDGQDAARKQAISDARRKMAREIEQAVAKLTSAPAQEDDEAPFPPLAEIVEGAIKAVTLLDDWTNVNETDFTGWGDQIVPPGATFMRVKSGQALKAIKEIALLREKRP